MKALISIPLIVSILFTYSTLGIPAYESCKDFTYYLKDMRHDDRLWGIRYNQFYKKYAVVSVDSSRIDTEDYLSFLLKNGYGEYGVYSGRWQDCKGLNICASPSKSFFSSPCDAKKFLLTYIRKTKQDNWK